MTVFNAKMVLQLMKNTHLCVRGVTFFYQRNKMTIKNAGKPAPKQASPTKRIMEL